MTRTPTEINFLTHGTTQEAPSNIQYESAEKSNEEVLGLDFISLQVEVQQSILQHPDATNAEESTDIYPSDTTAGKNTLTDKDVDYGLNTLCDVLSVNQKRI